MLKNQESFDAETWHRVKRSSVCSKEDPRLAIDICVCVCVGGGGG